MAKALKDSAEKLKETILLGLKTEVLRKDLKKAIGTRCQEKYHIQQTQVVWWGLIKLCRRHSNISLKQTYKFVSKKALFKAGCYYRAKQRKRAGKETKKLKTYLGRVSRDFERKMEGVSELHNLYSSLLSQVNQVLTQTKNSKNKLYSYHAPEVECIGKGKAQKRYEFGVKVSIATPHKRNFVIGAKALPGNPFDGHTLKNWRLQ